MSIAAGSAHPALNVTALDLEGRGVARADGKVVFITGAITGERVIATVTRARGAFDEARLDEVLVAAADRAVPRCAHFGLARGACGGCSMQHVGQRTQVAAKQRVLEDTLWHLARLRPQQILRPVHGLPWGYRQRARLGARYVDGKGGSLVGFRERASSYVADLKSCAVLPRRVSDLLLPLRKLVGGLSIRRRMPQVEVAMGAGGVIALVLRILEPLTADDRRLVAAFGEIHGVDMWLQPQGPDTMVPLDPATARPLLLELGEFGVRIEFRPADFTQVNHEVNEILVRRALRLLAPRPGERILDFFCGLGNFSLPIATTGARVLGIEGAVALVERARAAARSQGLGGRAEFDAADLFKWQPGDWQRAEARLGGRIDAVLIDPPRDGAHALAQHFAAMAGLGEPRPRRLVYVSCNPATLARDCGAMVNDGGWVLRAAGIVNMFPHTAHVESMAVLEPDLGKSSRESVERLEKA